MAKYIVYSPGRTGTTLICENIRKHFDNRKIAYVVHNPQFMHSDSFIPLTDDMVCIRSRRHNVFNYIIRAVISEKISEAKDYTNNHIEPFYVDPKQVINLYFNYRNFYDKIDTSQYSKVVDLFYEDLFKNPCYMFKQMGIEDAFIDYSLCDKAPHDYKNIIKNFNQLNELVLSLADK